MTDPSLEVMAKLVSSFYGWKWAQEDVADMGRAALKKELAFNRNAGLGPATDRLPDFFKEEALSPHVGTFRVSNGEIDKVLDL
jgi:aldehyde:ferredoxin oxidoreductase